MKFVPILKPELPVHKTEGLYVSIAKASISSGRCGSFMLICLRRVTMKRLVVV